MLDVFPGQSFDSLVDAFSRIRLGTHVEHKCPLAAARLYVAVFLKASVHLADRVVVDVDAGRQAAHRGQLVARRIMPRRDEVDEALLQLQPQGNAAGLIKGEEGCIGHMLFTCPPERTCSCACGCSSRSRCWPACTMDHLMHNAPTSTNAAATANALRCPGTPEPGPEPEPEPGQARPRAASVTSAQRGTARPHTTNPSHQLAAALPVLRASSEACTAGFALP